MTRKTKVFLVLTALVLLVGIGSAIDLTYIHFKVSSTDGEYKSFCNVNDVINCDTVTVSPWSTLLGIPISILGSLTYLFALLLVVLKFTSVRKKLPNIGVYLLWMSFGSVIYSLYLAWICYSEIGSWCIMCMVLYLVNLMFFLFATQISEAPISRQPGLLWSDFKWLFGSWKRILVCFVLFAIVVGTFSAGAYSEYQEEKAKLAEVMKKLTKLPKPVSDESDRIIGNPEGSISVLVYSDYQCPFCRKVDLMLEELIPKFKELRIVRREFPLDHNCNATVRRPYHLNACRSSYHAICAAEQGKYAEYHRYLLEHQREIGSKLFTRSIEDLGLDWEKMSACLQGKAVRKDVQADIKRGLEIKLPGTPALVFNRELMLIGGLTIKELEEIILVLSKE